MKILPIALKDFARCFRSPFSLVLMLGAPLLITALLYFAFGGLATDGSGFQLPKTRVQVANLDQPNPQAGGLAAGQMLVDSLQAKDVADLVQVTQVPDEASARAAVENRKADVAIIIPANFSASAISPAAHAAITLYQDPTLTVGPAIVKGLVDQFVDGFAGDKIATKVVAAQLSKRGIQMDAATTQGIAMEYAAWLQGSGHHQSEAGALLTLDTRSPAGEAASVNQGSAMTGSVMAGMMIFFAFFMGANAAESIIREDEEGTLARLFTTPTSRTVILGGKLVAVFLTLAAQIILLLVAAMVLFGIRWGDSLAVTLAAVGLIAAAAGFGVLIMSFVKNTRQAGPVMGGLLAIMGMLGGLFTSTIPNAPAALDAVSLVTPHGWAMRCWKIALAGGSAGDVFPSFAVLAGMGALFFVAGVIMFRKRFA